MAPTPPSGLRMGADAVIGHGMERIMTDRRVLPAGEGDKGLDDDSPDEPLQEKHGEERGVP